MKRNPFKHLDFFTLPPSRITIITESFPFTFLAWPSILMNLTYEINCFSWFNIEWSDYGAIIHSNLLCWTLIFLSMLLSFHVQYLNIKHTFQCCNKDRWVSAVLFYSSLFHWSKITLYMKTSSICLFCRDLVQKDHMLLWI